MQLHARQTMLKPLSGKGFVPPASINRGELMAAITPRSIGFRIDQPDVASDVSVLSGHFRADNLREGLRCKCVDVVDLYDMRTEATLQPGLSLIVLVAGEAQARFGSQPVSLGGTGQPDGALVALAAPEQFVRHSRRGRHERKVVITMSPEWLAASGLDVGGLAAFRQKHLAVHHWRPSTRAVAIAQQMIHPPVFSTTGHSNPLHKLHLESRALALITESFADLFAAPTNADGIAPRMRARIADLCEWLDASLQAGTADELDLAAIARHAGLNASSLQQQFRAVQGMSIVAWLRSRRLDAARVALERDGLSVAQAAELAGYSSAANFATAFRKHFGQCPSAVARAG
ncbi:helix-turn-helix transcriptional regulator [Viridibacterium curvum]|uniref:helix-turn-helix transcriptional regulator n=1 Tax=Viridibacterium curvum TaxID=1101404 RepID=UPI0031E69E38